MRLQDARRDAWSGVRRVLASYARSDPAALEFARDPAGKPRLVGRHAIDFSLSHAEGLAVVAVSCSSGIGVDVEAMRTFEDADGLARRFLSPPEHETVARADPVDRDRVFLQAWTRKEAVLKAVGVGLTWDTRRPQSGTGPGTTRVGAGLPGGVTASVRSAFLSPDWLLAVAWMSCGEEPVLRAFDASMLDETVARRRVAV